MQHAPEEKADKRKVDQAADKESGAKTDDFHQRSHPHGTGHQSQVDTAVVTSHGQAAEPGRHRFSDEGPYGGKRNGIADAKGKCGQQEVIIGPGGREAGDGEG